MRCRQIPSICPLSPFTRELRPRQRLREDLQRQHPGPGRAEPASDERARRYAEWQRMSPEQREGIRREMRDANRDFDRRR